MTSVARGARRAGAARPRRRARAHGGRARPSRSASDERQPRCRSPPDNRAGRFTSATAALAAGAGARFAGGRPRSGSSCATSASTPCASPRRVRTSASAGRGGTATFMIGGNLCTRRAASATSLTATAGAARPGRARARRPRRRASSACGSPSSRASPATISRTAGPGRWRRRFARSARAAPVPASRC